MKKAFLFVVLLSVFGMSSWSQHYAVIGTGTSNTNGNPVDPVERVYPYEHFQLVYLASELTSAGMPAGAYINALGFSVSEATAELVNYKISMAHTLQSLALPYIATGFLTVKNPFTYYPTEQIADYFDMIPFDTPFNWDGSSNIVVDICTGPNETIAPWGGLRYTSSNPVNAIERNRRDVSANCALETNSGTFLRANIQFEFIPPPPCSGTPAPGNTLSTTTTICPEINFVLSLQNLTPGAGVTYLWQSSTDGNVWTATGGTSSSYSTSQTSTTWYRCQVSCSGNTGISTPIQVAMNNFLNCYCPSTASYPDNSDIFGVTVNGVTNAYNCTTVAPGAGSVLNMYSNFFPLGAIFELPKTVTVPFLIHNDNCTTPSYIANTGCSIWIDYNHDGDFNDANEQVFLDPYAIVLPRDIIGNFLVPDDVVLGQTGMRIMNVEGFAGASLTPCLNYGYGETEDYLVNIVPPPPCPNPSLQSTTNITNTSATLDWVSGGTENQWNILYGPAGFDPKVTGILVSGINSHPYSLTQLSPSTSYDWYVQAVCNGSATSSILTGPKNFNTPCNPVPETSLPWTENFDNMTLTGNNIFPSCWVAESASGTPWSSGNSASITVNDPCSTPNYVYVSWIPIELPKYLITPGFNLKVGVGYEFSFNWIGDSYLGWTGDVMVNTSQTGVGATQLGASFITGGANSTACTNLSRTFIAPANGTYYFMVRIENITGPIAMGFDDFQLIVSASCTMPINLQANPSATQATLGWTSPSADLWDIEFGAVPHAFTGTPTITGVTNPYILTDLISSTQYIYKVRANCGSGSYSPWSDPFTFTTATTVPVNLTVTGTVIPPQNNCYNAVNTITVAGTGTFTVQAGGMATFIAGEKILFMQGTSAAPGAFMHGYISNTYCSPTEEPMMAATISEATTIVAETAAITVYPNPTAGSLTVEHMGDAPRGETTLDIFNLNGLKVISAAFSGMKYELTLKSLPSGIYIMKLIAENSVVTVKVVKNEK